MPRFSFLVSTKVAKRAVERNRVKRIFSEAVKGMVDSLSGYDFIVFAARGITAVPKADIVKDFLGVLKKIK